MKAWSLNRIVLWADAQASRTTIPDKRHFYWPLYCAVAVGFFSLFVSWPVSVDISLRYDRYQLVDGLKEDLFSPCFAINWQPWLTTSWRASAGSGFRASTIGASRRWLISAFHLISEIWSSAMILMVAWWHGSWKDKLHEPLAFRPKLLATYQSSLRYGNLQRQVDYRYISKINEVKSYPINDRIPMKLLEVRIIYEIWKLSFLLGGNNLL